MTGLDRRASLGRLALLVAALVALALALGGLLLLAGRDPRPALAAGCGIVGLGLVAVGIVVLGLARGAAPRVTGATAFGTLALSVPFLAAALVI